MDLIVLMEPNLGVKQMKSVTPPVSLKNNIPWAAGAHFWRTFPYLYNNYQVLFRDFGRFSPTAVSRLCQMGPEAPFVAIG